MYTYSRHYVCMYSAASGHYIDVQQTLQLQDLVHVHLPSCHHVGPAHPSCHTASYQVHIVTPKLIGLVFL